MFCNVLVLCHGNTNVQHGIWAIMTLRRLLTWWIDGEGSGDSNGRLPGFLAFPESRGKAYGENRRPTTTKGDSERWNCWIVMKVVPIDLSWLCGHFDEVCVFVGFVLSTWKSVSYCSGQRCCLSAWTCAKDVGTRLNDFWGCLETFSQPYLLLARVLTENSFLRNLNFLNTTWNVWKHLEVI